MYVFRFSTQIKRKARGEFYRISSILTSADMNKSTRKVLAIAVVVTTIVSIFFQESLISGLNKARRLSINLGDGECEWKAAIQYRDEGFPSSTTFLKTIIAGYPSGDKRLTFTQLEGLTGLSARDEWDFKFLGMTNQPFIKANYPHHEGIWGWGDVGDQVILVVSELRRVLVEYHDILWVSNSFTYSFAQLDKKNTNFFLPCSMCQP